MLGQILWWAGIAQECVLLIRSVQGGFCRRYSLFYAYLSYVLWGELLRFYVYIFHPGFYQHFYWNTQFVSVLLGYGVIWEIYRQALGRYPGAARMARDLTVSYLHSGRIQGFRHHTKRPPCLVTGYNHGGVGTQPTHCSSNSAHSFWWPASLLRDSHWKKSERDDPGVRILYRHESDQSELSLPFWRKVPCMVAVPSASIIPSDAAHLVLGPMVLLSQSPARNAGLH